MVINKKSEFMMAMARNLANMAPEDRANALLAVPTGAKLTVDILMKAMLSSRKSA